MNRRQRQVQRTLRRAELQKQRGARADQRGMVKNDRRRAAGQVKKAIDELRGAKAIIERLIRAIPEADPLEDHMPAMNKLLKALRKLRDDLEGAGQ